MNEFDYNAAVQAFLAVNLEHTPRPAPAVPQLPSRNTVRPGRKPIELPCRRHDPSLWFAEAPHELAQAKALCAQCPIRLACLSVAVDRGEFAGVWGGHIFDRGRIVAYKRGRGRPRKHRNLCGTSTGGVALAREDLMPTDPPLALEHGSNEVRAAAAQVYDAECALHTAHQSSVDAWIDAANRRLHNAVTDYIAVATTPQSNHAQPSSPPARTAITRHPGQPRTSARDAGRARPRR
jgi:WhiB family redox-sensing transcriptional regulator